MKKAFRIPFRVGMIFIVASPVHTTAGPLSVVTLNILYGTADRPGHSWETRQAAVVSVLKTFHPDLIGLQEVLDFQLEYLVENLGSRYSVVGEGREGGTRGEYAPILFNNERFHLARADRFWLSETPEAAGSKSWASLPRIVTWVVLVEKQTDRRLFFANTHFAHDSAEARFKSALLIQERFRRIVPQETAAILVGDFNCEPGSAPYEVLTASGELKFKDAAAAFGVSPGPTYGGFRSPPPWEGAPIDWILFRGSFKPIDFRIQRSEYEGVIPSDHYPVHALFEWR